LVEIVIVTALLGLLAALGISRMNLYAPPPERTLQRCLLYAQGEARKSFSPYRIRTEEGKLLLESRSGELWRERRFPWDTESKWTLREEACYCYADGSVSPSLFSWGEEGARKNFFISVTGQVVPRE